MHFEVDNKIFESFDKLRIGVLLIRNINNNVSVDLLEKYSKTHDMPRSQISSLPEIVEWRKAYSSMGAKPKKYKCSVEALLRRVVMGDSIPSINPIVDLYNALSIKYILPIGGDDLDKVDGKIRLTFAKGDEEFKAINSGDVEHPKEGEIIYRDDKDVLCRRWNWRESDKTKLTNDSKNIIIYIESMITDLDPAIIEFKEKIREYFGITPEAYILDKQKHALGG